jgi:hypothetical protein
VQKMWKRIGDNPTHYCSMWAASTYRVCKGTWWSSKSYPSETGRNSWIDWRQKSMYKYTPGNVLENDNFKLYWNRSIITDKTILSNRPDITLMKEKNKEHLFDRHSCPEYT